MKYGDSYLLLCISDIDRNDSISEVLKRGNRTIILPADDGGLTSVESRRSGGLGDLEKNQKISENIFWCIQRQ